MSTTDSYTPIEEYGVIGNLRTVAHVSIDGSIDWCCLPRMDSPSVLAAILDAEKGGAFSVRPAGSGKGVQDYVEDTNVLSTRFTAGFAKLDVTDFMPLSGDLDGRDSSEAPPEVHRLLECSDAPVTVKVRWFPRHDFARGTTVVEMREGAWIASCGEMQVTLAGLPPATVDDDGAVVSKFVMEPGDQLALVMRWGADALGADLDATLEALERTVATWNEWAHQEALETCGEWAGPYRLLVTRSALAIKLMSLADSGAIAAAPTTSLPEEIGGVRNWDYRYVWIRDAAMTAQALLAIGHQPHAVELLEWFEEISEEGRGSGDTLQIMFGLCGEKSLEEEQLDHLEGYRGSQPVNIGNGAYEQFQLEIYGELASAAYELVRSGHKLSPDVAKWVEWVADHVIDVWERPDEGIWEIRGEPQHFVYSKAMAWLALDRAILLAEQYGLEGDVARWHEERERIKQDVIEQGFDEESNSFTASYECKEIDAANLRLGLMEFLPPDDPRIQGTIDRVMDELMSGNCLVKRYMYDDGLPGVEGAFGLCTFWLVDMLALSGRLEEARKVFDAMVARASHLGLYSEEIDPETGAFLGNFPQAFTHIGLINSTIYLAYAEGKDVPGSEPMGTPGHRKITESKEEDP
jgi:GH15 family glucan-1,4-alpha-glucosidase